MGRGNLRSPGKAIKTNTKDSKSYAGVPKTEKFLARNLIKVVDIVQSYRMYYIYRQTYLKFKDLSDLFHKKLQPISTILAYKELQSHYLKFIQYIPI